MILHCLDKALHPEQCFDYITEDQMVRALQLADWLKEHQKQVWQLFTPKNKARQPNPIETAFMRVIIELHGDKQEGWNIANSELFPLVREKLGIQVDTAHLAKPPRR